MSPLATASEPISAAGMTVQFLLEAEQTGGTVSVFRCDLSAGAHIPAPHSHDDFDETVYGLSGVTTFTVDGVRADVGPGDVLFVPRGAIHGFAVRGDEAASILCVSTPGSFGRSYFTEMVDVFRAAGGGAPDREAIFAVMRRHGLTPAAR